MTTSSLRIRGVTLNRTPFCRLSSLQSGLFCVALSTILRRTVACLGISPMETITHPTLVQLVAAGAVRVVVAVGQPGGWTLLVRYGLAERCPGRPAQQAAQSLSQAPIPWCSTCSRSACAASR